MPLNIPAPLRRASGLGACMLALLAPAKSEAQGSPARPPIEIASRVAEVPAGLKLDLPAQTGQSSDAGGETETRTFKLTPVQLEALVKELNQERDFRLLSEPHIITRSGQGATLSAMRDSPGSGTGSKEASLKLACLPTVGSGGAITLDVRFSLTRAAGKKGGSPASVNLDSQARVVSTNPGSGDATILSRRSLRARATLRQGQTLLLSDSPAPGSGTARLLVFITARLVTPSARGGFR